MVSPYRSKAAAPFHRCSCLILLPSLPNIRSFIMVSLLLTPVKGITSIKQIADGNAKRFCYTV